MTTIASQELQRDTGAVLDRVAAGEDLTVTVNGRPVARLVAADPRPRFMPADEFLRGLRQADP